MSTKCGNHLSSNVRMIPKSLRSQIIQREKDKPRPALNNITAGVREREETNRTGVAEHLDEIQGVVASTLKSYRNGAVRCHEGL